MISPLWATRRYGCARDQLGLPPLHPLLDAWIVTDGYGRALSRPGLDVRRRELCAIAMLVPQNVPRQLHSHLRGAWNAGASEQDVDETLTIIEAMHGSPAARLTAARALWSELRACS